MKTNARASSWRTTTLAILVMLAVGAVSARGFAEVKPGDFITMQNAPKVKDLVSPGVYYKVEKGMSMKIVPTARIDWPPPYKDATEKYSAQVTLTPSKRSILGYVAGQPFPLIDSNDPEVAVKGAHCVVTDTWVSMGDTEGTRHNLLKPYQVNARLMAKARPDALFMHCLPAHRGEEVTDEVIDGPQSVVFDEAENRLHAQKGILAWCFRGGES